MLSHALKRRDGIDIWNVTRTLGISVRDAAAAFKSLNEKGFLKEHDDALKLTAKGRGWIMQNQSAFAFSGERHWRSVPKSFQAQSIAAYEPYAPRIPRLDKAFFNLGNSKNER